MPHCLGLPYWHYQLVLSGSLIDQLEGVQKQTRINSAVDTGREGTDETGYRSVLLINICTLPFGKLES